jgi:hypothetical protein
MALFTTYSPSHMDTDGNSVQRRISNSERVVLFMPEQVYIDGIGFGRAPQERPENRRPQRKGRP